MKLAGPVYVIQREGACDGSGRGGTLAKEYSSEIDINGRREYVVLEQKSDLVKGKLETAKAVDSATIDKALVMSRLQNRVSAQQMPKLIEACARR